MTMLYVSILLVKKYNVAIILSYSHKRFDVTKCDWNNFKRFNYKAEILYVFLSCSQQICHIKVMI